MISLVKTVQPEDYSEIGQGVAAVKQVTEFLQSKGARIEIGHHHRFWEYGTAVQALLSTAGEGLGKARVLDVGAGFGALGPTLAYSYGTEVLECEPMLEAVNARTVTNKILEAAGKRTIQVLPAPIERLPDGKFDAVFCISVIEHLTPSVEANCWQDLAKRVKDGGLLFVTVDCVWQLGRSYIFDNLRQQNFTPESLRPRVEAICEMGFVPMGVPDYDYHGNEVHDYTFMRMGFVKMTRSDFDGQRQQRSGQSRTDYDVGRTVRNSRVRPESNK